MGHRALRFMAGFQCAGADCEDTCCANWQIDVDRHHFVKIARVLSRTAEGRVELGRAFQLLPEDKQTISRFVRMELTEDSKCFFWGEDKLCSLQRRFSERYLPDVCAHYPRSISLVEDKMELSGQLSCPEVTRRAILDPAGCELVDVVVDSRFARGGVRQRTGLDSADPYYAKFLETRETVWQLLDRRDHPMRSRLFFALCFAQRTAGFFHRGTSIFDEELWQAERASWTRKELLDEAHAALQVLPIPEGMALFVIAQVLAGDVRSRSGGKFQQVVTEVLDSYSVELRDRAPSAEDMWDVFIKRRDAKQQRHAARLDQFFESYCKQFWFKEWYVDSVDLARHLQGLLVRVAVLRFLLLSHPLEDLDKLAVEVFYGMARGIDHHDEFLKLIGEGLRGQLPTLLHAASLLFV
jgi:lysine-N-methylase